MFRGITLAVLMLAAGGAAAGDKAGQLDVNSGFEAQRMEIQKALNDGKTYSEIGFTERGEVNAALARISTALGPSGDATRLNETQKLQVFNDQELINNILTKAGGDSRLICKREKKTGSHMPSNQCMTVAERRRAAEHARDQLTRTPPHSLQR